MESSRTLFLKILPQAVVMLGTFQGVFGQTVPILNGDFERLASTSSVPGWLEGPAYDGAGGIWFSDLTIPIVDPVGTPSVFRYDLVTDQLEQKLEDSGGANGLAFDAEGYLIAAHGADKNLTRRRTDALDDVTVLADNFQGNPLRGPNDITIDDKGGIYFTDPSGNPADNSVFYLSATNELQQVSTGIWFNNGLVLSPDGDTLYVASTANQNVVAFDVHEDGSLSNQRVFADPPPLDGRTFTPDGMTIDYFGNVYAADIALPGGPETLGSFDPTVPGAKVRVFNPLGEEVLTFNTPDKAAANLLFGPDDMLYITATDALYRVPISFVSAEFLDSDYDGDGDTDGNDFLNWQRQLGSTGLDAYAGADGTGDGNVDAADLLILEQQFGMTLADLGAASASSSATVPEPSTTVLFALASLLIAGRPRR